MCNFPPPRGTCQDARLCGNEGKSFPTAGYGNLRFTWKSGTGADQCAKFNMIRSENGLVYLHKIDKNQALLAGYFAGRSTNLGTIWNHPQCAIRFSRRQRRGNSPGETHADRGPGRCRSDDQGALFQTLGRVCPRVLARCSLRNHYYARPIRRVDRRHATRHDSADEDTIRGCLP